MRTSSSHSVYRHETDKGSITTQKRDNKIVNISVNTGGGLAAKVSVGVVKVDVGFKMYNSVTTTGTPTRNLQGGIGINVTSKAKLALEGSRTIDSNGRTSGSGFAGIAVDDHKFGVGDSGTEGDLKVSFGVGAWMIVGGEVNVDVNLSAAARKVQSEVINPAIKKISDSLNKLNDPRTWGIKFPRW